MGRPSNKDQRFSQVMTALMRCVARYGLDGTTLSKIAQQSGLSRPLIRHHLGNREEVISALARYVLDEFTRSAVELIDTLPKHKPAERLIELLFSSKGAIDANQVLAFAALTARSAEDQALRLACQKVLLQFEQRIESVLASQFPKVAQDKRVMAAHGISALYYNVASLEPLAMPALWENTARAAAFSFVQSLKES